MKTVLITGGTGVIGSVLARCFLDEPNTRVRLLIRGRSAAHLNERVDALRRFWALYSSSSDDMTRLEAIAGDVTQEHLGLDDESCARLTREVTHFIHCAGDVKLNRTLEEATRSAVDSVRHVVSFAEAARQRGALEKIEVVSTVGVAGSMPGVVPESALTNARAFRNTYEEAKAQAETFVLRKIDEGLPATIHRPSMVIGDSKNGAVIQFQVFYHLCELLSGRRTGGLIPDARGTTLDVIPVDYVAQAIQAASNSPDTVGRIFHLCSGPSDALHIPDLASRVQELFASHGIPVPRVRSIPLKVVDAVLPLARRVATGKLRRALASLPYFLAYLDTKQTFANTRTSEFLSAVGVAKPQMGETLSHVLSYYLSRQYPSTGSSAFEPSSVVA